MLQVGLALAAASLSVVQAPAPAADARIQRLVGQGECLAQLDQQFVRFVPPAAASGRNPLFRLVSASPSVEARSRPVIGCLHALTRTADRP